MSLTGALRNLWRSIAPRSHSDVEEELRSHLAAYAEDLMLQGLTAEEAQRKARIDLGQPATQNETYRAAIGLRIFDELGGDLRYGLRALSRTPASPPSLSSHSPSASAPPPRCSRSSTPSCSIPSPTPARTAS